jgi:hypothetical protein
MMSTLLMGSDCEEKRLDGLDHGLMVSESGLELKHIELPCVVIGQEFEHPESFHNAIERINYSFSHAVVVTGEIDKDYFSILDIGPVENRYGVVLVSVGYVGNPTWHQGLDIDDPGGISNLVWDEETGEILYADVILNVDYAYDEEWTTQALIHELGHACFALDHDEVSEDLGSCMSSPQPYNCEILQSDVERVLN